jgi:hypothetical protein
VVTSGLKTRYQALVLCDVVGGPADAPADLLDDVPIRRLQNHPYAGRAGVAARAAVGME